MDYTTYLKNVLGFPMDGTSEIQAIYRMQGYYFSFINHYYKTGNFTDRIPTKDNFINLEKTFQAFIADYMFTPKVLSNATINPFEPNSLETYSPIKLWTTTLAKEILSQFKGLESPE